LREGLRLGFKTKEGRSGVGLKLGCL